MGGHAVLVSDGTVEGEVGFEDREVLEILGDAVNWQDLFKKGVFSYHFGALPDAAVIAFLGVNLVPVIRLILKLWLYPS